MPASSKKQFRFMMAVAHNKKLKTKPTGLTPQKAKEYVSHNEGPMNYSNLPEQRPDSAPLPKKRRKFNALKKVGY